MKNVSSPRSSVRVVVRCRPLLPAEREHRCSRVALDPAQGKVAVYDASRAETRCFAFDRVWPPEAQQAEVMAEVGPLVEHVLGGLHATVFAYGQTGSGKTYTVEGVDYIREHGERLRPHLKGDPRQHGIIPRSIQLIYDRARQIQLENENVRFQIKCSFYQIYNERVMDLLNPTTSLALGSGLKVGWQRGDTFNVENLFVCECDQPEKMRRIFLSGAKEKIMSSHNMNQQSSRSHSVFTIYVTNWNTDSPEETIKSEFSIVDLAGSEKLTMLSRDPSACLMKESIDINTSLFALGKVITALATASKKKLKNGEWSDKSHIPYRDSKLTKLLKHALGGNSLTTMIACISPSDKYIDETLSTLLYAGRARNITNVPHINEDPKTLLIRQLRAEVASMRKELDYYRNLAGGSLSKAEYTPSCKTGEVISTEDNQINELADRLLQACEALKNIIDVNGQLRNAFDTIKGAKSELEKREVELNAENLLLRERIEMLESIALQDDFLDNISTQNGINNELNSNQNHHKKDIVIHRNIKSSLSADNNFLVKNDEISSKNKRSYSAQTPRNIRRCNSQLEQFTSKKDSKEVVNIYESHSRPLSSNLLKEEISFKRNESENKNLSRNEKTQKKKRRKEQQKNLVNKLKEYTNMYYKPNQTVNYTEYYGKARQQIPVNRTAAATIKEMENTLKNIPESIAETIPQSLKFISQFGSLAFGGEVSEELVDLEKRRKEREEKRNALLARQQALRRSVERAFENVTEQFMSGRHTGIPLNVSTTDNNTSKNNTNTISSVAWLPYGSGRVKSVRSATPPSSSQMISTSNNNSNNFNIGHSIGISNSNSNSSSRLRAYLDLEEAKVSNNTLI